MKRLTQAPPVSANVAWWLSCCQPDQREQFILAAKVRHLERTKLEDTKDGKRNQAMRHIIDPRHQ